jgi:hypothetical protein
MNKEQDKERQETHPLFPSGEWEGFYTYATGPGEDRHDMHLMLNFKDNLVTGSGGDDVGSFSWKGSYNKEQLECKMTKRYSTHSVFYKGQADENGIWGLWEMEWLKGGFHIWPKASSQNEEAEELAVVEEIMVQKEYLVFPKEIKSPKEIKK